MLDKENSRFAKVCILILGLNKRVNLKINPGNLVQLPDTGTPVEGWYFEKDDFHSIAIALGANRGWREVLAHELVHAWIVENHPKAKDHGRTFQRTCASMRKALRNWGYIVGPLYKKGLDV